MAQDTGKFRKNTKDQYYTKASVAKTCIDAILESVPNIAAYQWIEPSAGNGVFLKALPATVEAIGKNKWIQPSDGSPGHLEAEPAAVEAIGIDLDPKSPGIQQGNFLDWAPTSTKRRIFFGNPPFGRQGSLAKSFIKHAAKYGDIIAFILPRSFVKPSMSRAFPLEFHCIHSEELEKNAFEVNGVAYDVPCVFQIWEKRVVNRVIAAPIEAVGFRYVKEGQPFHIAFQRVGGMAGKCFLEGVTDYNPNFHYFLKLDEAYVPHIRKIIDTVCQHTFPSNTVGPRSLSKSEANEVLNRVLASCA